MSKTCLADGDCWHGNYTGSAQCLNNSGTNTCVLATCTTSDNCTAGEACISGKCVTLGLQKAPPGNINLPVPCTGVNCYGSNSGIYCDNDPSSTMPPLATTWACKSNSDCPTGLTCPTGSNYCVSNGSGLGYCVQCTTSTQCGTGECCVDGSCTTSCSSKPS